MEKDKRRERKKDRGKGRKGRQEEVGQWSVLPLTLRKSPALFSKKM